RVDIISPGHLPGGLTVFGMRCGCSRIRNSVLASYAAMGLLPFRGCGSGIRRSLEAWPAIDFASSAEDGLFTVSVRRKSV
ncbi:MAG: ATP-binding protein, partial [Desulfovibrionaceae bacterium]|nr:ATP-binding protein [Desulfovibrionaceae bacterium]